MERFAPKKISNIPIEIYSTPEETLRQALVRFGQGSSQYEYAKDLAKKQLRGKLYNVAELDVENGFNALCIIVENK